MTLDHENSDFCLQDGVTIDAVDGGRSVDFGGIDSVNSDFGAGFDGGAFYSGSGGSSFSDFGGGGGSDGGASFGGSDGSGGW